MGEPRCNRVLARNLRAGIADRQAQRRKGSGGGQIGTVRRVAHRIMVCTHGVDDRGEETRGKLLSSLLKL